MALLVMGSTPEVTKCYPKLKAKISERYKHRFLDKAGSALSKLVGNQTTARLRDQSEFLRQLMLGIEGSLSRAENSFFSMV